MLMKAWDSSFVRGAWPQLTERVLCCGNVAVSVETHLGWKCARSPFLLTLGLQHGLSGMPFILFQFPNQ